MAARWGLNCKVVSQTLPSGIRGQVILWGEGRPVHRDIQQHPWP